MVFFALTRSTSSTITLLIDLPPGDIRGRIVDADSAPAARAIVEVRDATGQQHVTASDASGEFLITGVGAGHVVVHATRGDRQGSVESEIEPPKTATIEIVLRKKEQTAGDVAVSTPNGQPLGGAVVFLLGSGALPAGVSTTDVNGHATFQLAEPLTAPAAAYSPSYGWAWMPAASISGDSSRNPIRMSAVTGSLIVSGVSSANIELFTSSGIALTPAFSTLGVPMSVGAGADLRLTGLPPGGYTLQAGAFRASASVESGKDARITLH